MGPVDLQALMRRRVLVFDGASGTMLGRTTREGWCPDELSLSQPEAVAGVHRAYVAAGADLIQTSTFGANRLKLDLYGLGAKVQEINSAAAGIARQEARLAGRPCYVAGCIGPTGRLLRPYGELDPRECYEVFLEQAQALAGSGVDLFNIETMSDILEAKLAVIAARTAAPELAVLCSLTYEGGVRTLTGTDPEAAAVLLEALAVTAIGTNCGGGPAETALAAERLAAATDFALIIRPNAGLPKVGPDGEAIWTVTPEQLVPWVEQYLAAGANIVGGCCGTTPEHIAAIVRIVDGRAPVARAAPDRSLGRLSGAGRTVVAGGGNPTRIVGERLNPTARPELQQALAAGQWEFIASEALAQVGAGADLIDINVAVPGLSEPDLMEQAVLAVQKAVPVPVSLDSTDPAALERGLFVCRGKPLLNSTTADPDKLAELLALARRYGAAIVGLPMEGGRVPREVGARMDLARRIVDAAKEAGLPSGDVFVDGLVMTASVHAKLAGVALATVAGVREELGARTILGLSNVSHGLPARDHFNAAYLAMAVAGGVDMLIANPMAPVVSGVLRAADVLAGRDPRARNYIGWATGAGPGAGAQGSQSGPDKAGRAHPTETPDRDLLVAVRDGDSYVARELASVLLRAGLAPLSIIEKCIVAGLEEIGLAYEAKRAFLPQLLLAAEAAQAAFAVVEGTGGVPEIAPESGSPEQTLQRRYAGRVVLATVKGDMHDIGKGIVGLLLRSHGFEVVDLGRDVSAQAVVEAVKASAGDLVALSALMTTTMPEMERTVKALREAGLSVPVLIGGAVVTAAYADSIGAAYAPDAVAGVRAARKLLESASEDGRD